MNQKPNAVVPAAAVAAAAAVVVAAAAGDVVGAAADGEGFEKSRSCPAPLLWVG